MEGIVFYDALCFYNPSLRIIIPRFAQYIFFLLFIILFTRFAKKGKKIKKKRHYCRLQSFLTMFFYMVETQSENLDDYFK